MKRVILLIEDDELRISSQMFFVKDSDKNSKKLKKIERDLFNFSGASWHGFHYRLLNRIAVKQLFGKRAR